MCTPVLPNTHHPTSRRALCPVRPLPWANCYHASFETVTVRVPTQFADAREATTLPFEEMGEHMEAIQEDADRRDQLKAVYKAANTRSEVGTATPKELPTKVTDEGVVSDKTPENYRDELEWADDGKSDAGDDDSRQSEDVDDDDADLRPPDTQPVAIMAYKLDIIEDVGDPQDLFEEIRLIQQ